MPGSLKKRLFYAIIMTDFAQTGCFTFRDKSLGAYCSRQKIWKSVSRGGESWHKMEMTL